MNIAMIIAGGSGARMQEEIPKQFLCVNGKPVMVYTMEAFENHPDIDAIAVVCKDGWQENLWEYAKEYNITKLKHVIPGGQTGQESIRNGVFALEECYQPKDIILIHDAIRPLVSKEVLDDCIRVATEHGSAIVCLPCVTSMMETRGQVFSDSSYPRDDIMETQTPQAFHLKILSRCHREALEKGITNETASCTLMTRLGVRVYLSKGSERNIKLTTQEDMDLFYALVNMTPGEWRKSNGKEKNI